MNKQVKTNKKICEILDERSNGDGWWIYLKKEYADFDFDSLNPTRTIHEQRKSDAMARVKQARLITEKEFEKYPYLRQS